MSEPEADDVTGELPEWSDLLDLFPAARGDHRAKLGETALAVHYRSISPLDFEYLVSDFCVVHHTETWGIRHRWAEDSRFDGGEMPGAFVQWSRHKQILATISPIGGWSFMESAVNDILVRYGSEAALAFIDRAWREKMFIDSWHACWPTWAIERSIAFEISYAQSRKEIDGAYTLAQPNENGGSMRDVVENMAAASATHGRAIRPLLDRYQKLHSRAEIALASARQLPTHSDWLRAIRDLLPSYVVANLIAEEAEFMAGEHRDPIVPLCRFVDERKADILAAFHGPTLLPFIDVLLVEDQRSRLRRIRFYDAGRVFYPHFVFNHFADMVQTDTINLNTLMDSIRSTMRAGHRWFLDQSNDQPTE